MKRGPGPVSFLCELSLPGGAQTLGVVGVGRWLHAGSQEGGLGELHCDFFRVGQGQEGRRGLWRDCGKGSLQRTFTEHFGCTPHPASHWAFWGFTIWWERQSVNRSL